MSAAPGALAGVRVLDLTRYIPGPYATMLLGDLGADVVKIEEPPVGDPTRALPPAVGERRRPRTRALNRNKRSVVVDLRTAKRARPWCARLAARGGRLRRGLPPGRAGPRGLGPDASWPRTRASSTARSPATAQDGPHAARAGHDIDYAALSAASSAATATPTGGRSLPAAQVADMAGGARRRRSASWPRCRRASAPGRGQAVDVSLLRRVLALMTVPRHARSWPAREPGDELDRRATPATASTAAATASYLAVGALEPKFWEALCRALGPARAGRRGSGSGARARAAHVEAVARAVRLARPRRRGSRELARRRRLRRARARTREAARASGRRGRRLEQPRGDARAAHGRRPPSGSPDTPPAIRRPAPRLGEHTDEVLARAGLRAPTRCAALASATGVARVTARLPHGARRPTASWS